MRKLKRICLLLAELLVEAILLGCLFGVMISDHGEVFKVTLGSIIAVPVILGLHGYYISRVLATVAWASKARWAYPACAALAFVAHLLFIASYSKSDLSPRAQALMLPFLVVGTCVVFACALAGNRLSTRWSRVSLRPSAGGPGASTSGTRDSAMMDPPQL
jgi:hypothetical protein